jgi:glutamate-1-semialdehyde 2,1-aminomutase
MEETSSSSAKTRQEPARSNEMAGGEPAERYAQSESLHQRALQVIPGGVNSSVRNIVPHLVFKQAQGANLVDADGNTYLDYHAAFGPVVLGHNHPAVNRAVIEALEGCALPGAGVTELEILLAERLCRLIPSAGRVLFCNSGSEATLHALRVARAFTARNKFIKFQGCYHGVHDAVLRNAQSSPGTAGRLDAASAGIPLESLQNTLVVAYNRLDEVEAAFAANRGEVAAVIVEPIAHNMGCVLPKPGFLQGLKSVCEQHGALLIFDEVITGFRHHLGGYQAMCGVTPHLTAFGKALANGFPIAAVCGQAEVMELFNTRPGGTVYYGGTYNGNAVGCAAALATLDILEREPVHGHIFRLGERMRKGLSEIVKRLGLRATVTGYGSIFLTYFLDGTIENYSDLLRNDAAKFVEYRRRLIERGIFKIPVNLKRNHIGYFHTEADIDRTLDICERVLKAMA